MRLFLDPAIKSQDDDWGFKDGQLYHFHPFWVMRCIMKTVVSYCPLFFIELLTVSLLSQGTGINIL